MVAYLMRDRRGGVTILAAAMMAVVSAVAALAVDIGSVCAESRRLQGVADAAALAAAGNLAAPTAAAKQAIAAAGWSRTMTPIVTTGTYVADPAIAAAARFSAGGSLANAAQVSVAADSPLFFGRIFGLRSIHLERRATAARIDLAAFSLGSRLAALDGGIVNQLLSGLTGSSVALSVADYNALLNTDIDLLSYVKALQTELGVTGLSYQQTLATQTTLPHILNALAATLAGQGNGAGANAVTRLAGSVPPLAMNLSALADLGALGQQDHAASGSAVAVNAFAALETMVELAAGSHQVALDLSASASGLLSVSATLAIGARQASTPWLALAKDGSVTVRTAQMRLYIDTKLSTSAALKGLNIATVRLPLYVELAQAQARLAAQSCAGGAQQVGVDVLPAIGHVAIADVSTANLQDMNSAPAEQPAAIVSIPGLTVAGKARVDLSSSAWQHATFNDAEIKAHATKTVSSSGIAGGIAASLVGSINLTINLIGLPISLPVLTGLLQPVLASAAALLDPVLDGTLQLLGVGLGQADVRINGTRCGVASLVA